MKNNTLLLLLLLMLVSIVFIDEGDAWFWRRRRRRNPPPRPVCQTLCEFQCNNRCRPYCCSRCYPKCSRKRSGLKEFIVPLPCEFSSWDTNGDGFVNKTEFSLTANARPHSTDVAYVYSIADVNGDKVLSKEELRKAPVIFAC
ncbi:EF-hand calcium-binding domain-containing protein 1-like [Saccostrea cucullata]|uniref:EF-hand calcium-binding domain-containing protein 1-like n=1 Tax=Saccostrea cuccullata TaxID=36930 RepID=UPI002ED3D00A